MYIIYTYTYIYVCVCIYIYTTLCGPTHLLIRHLCCWQSLRIVDNAAINMVYKYLFESLLSILWVIYLEVELLDHMVIL